MKMVTLGSTGITVPQNGFGALPIQRRNVEDSIEILRRAYEGGMRFFDTANYYTDSEEKIGLALADVRKDIYLATKTRETNPEGIKRHLDQSLRSMKTDFIDLYQLHQVDKCYYPGDGTGVVETLEDYKRQGVIGHFGVSSHKLNVAEECVKSGLYETIQFPFCYLSGEKDIELVELCRQHNVGFIAMKALAGGLINNSRAAMAFMTQYDNVLPIWGIQTMKELEEWLSFFENPAEMDDEIRAFIEQEKKDLDGEFCRGCGYCLPCPQGIKIQMCARIMLMSRRAPFSEWGTAEWRESMKTAETCIECGTCLSRCPYELNIPEILKKNCAEYKEFIATQPAI